MGMCKIKRDKTIQDLIDAAIKARAVLGDLVRAGKHSEDEDDAYIELREALAALGE